MANTILLKRSATPGKEPTTGQLSLGEIAINTYDGKMFIKKDNGTASVVQIGGVNSVNGSTGAVTLSNLTAGSGLTWSSGSTYNGGAASTLAVDTTTIATKSYVDSQVQTKDNTDEITEGATNLYFTNTRARSAISVTDSGGDGSLSYDSGTGVITYTGPSATEVRAHFSAGTGISITSGQISSTITQYTNTDARGAISVTDAGGDGSLSYNNTTGVFTYTGPSASDVRAHFSAGTGISYNSSTGAISIDSTVATLTGTQTLSNKTLTSPTINGATIGGHLIPSTDITYDLGSATYRFKDLYLSGSTIYLGTAQITATGSTVSLPAGSTIGGSGDVVDTTSTQTLTNKTLTSPTLTTPTLGIASATSINKLAITAPATGSTLTIADGKTLTVNNTVTLSGTDNSTVSFGGGGTVAYTSNKLSAFAATTSAELAGVISDETGTGALVFASSPTLVTPNIGVATATSVNGTTIPSSKTLVVTTDKLSALAATTSAELAGVISDETGSGALVFATSPSLTTPTLGVASATSINKVAITAPATSATLTIADGKTLTASNTLTFTGTDASSVAFGAGGTVAYTANKLSAFAATTSAELAGVISDETGTGALVFAGSPTFTGTANFAAISTSGNVTVGGDLTVNGTTTTINSTTLAVDDKNIILGDVATPTDTTADGGGITLKGATDKTLNWVDATDSWTSSEHFNLATGKAFYINGSSVLDATTLGSGVTGSSLTSVGTIGSGTWQGTVIGSTYGGTGVNNGGRTITLNTGNLTLTAQAAGSSVTVPASGTLATTSNKLSAFAATTSAELAGVISDETGSGALVFATSPVLTTPDLGTPSALTLTNATGLPVSGITGSTTTALGVGSLELGHASDTTLTRSSAGVLAVEGVVVPTISSTNTLTNKSLSDSTTFFIDETDGTKKMQFQLSGVTTGTTRTLTVPNVDGTIITTGDSGTVTNTMLAGSIANAKLTNSSVTVTAGTGMSGGGAVALGSSITLTNNGVVGLSAGTGISVSGSAGGTFTVTNSDLGSSQNIFKNFTDGTTTAAADSNNDTFKFRGSAGVTVAVGSDDATHGDNVLISLSSVPNSSLANSSVTVTAGTGLSGGGAVSLGGSVTLSNAGVTSAVAGTGVSVSAATGAVTFSIGQAVATNSNVQFNSLGVGTAASATAGEIRATNEITAYYSDARLKENIKPIENALAKTLSLNGVTYNANDLAASFGYKKTAQVGLLAQDVQAVLPEVVVPAPFDIEVRDGVEVSKSGENYMTVKYEKVVALLVEAVKELNQKVESLEAQLAAQKSL